jgi:hypothetical protein
MKKSSLILSSSIIIGSIFLLQSCKSEDKKDKISTEQTEEAKLDITLTPADKLTIAYVDSIAIKDTIIMPVYPKGDDLKSKMVYLRSQADYFWNLLERQEHAKFKNIDRLIKEISFNENHKPEDLKHIEELALKVKSQFIMRHELAIDTVKDSVHDKCLFEIFRIGDAIKDMGKFSLYGELKTEISRINNEDIISYRTAYLNAATLVNQNIEEHKDELVKQNIDTKKLDVWL